MKEIFKDIPNYEGLYQISNISLCCKGIYKQAAGYKWKYKEVV